MARQPATTAAVSRANRAQAVGSPTAPEAIGRRRFFVVFLPVWYVLQPYDNHGLWLAFMIFLGARGVGMHVVYRRRVLPAI